MTEEEWLACEEPDAILCALPTSIATERKCRLFSVGCCLKLLLWTPNEIAFRVPEIDYRADDERALAAVLIAERYADSTATATERQEAEATLSWVCSEQQGDKVYDACFEAACSLASVVIAGCCAMYAAHAVMTPLESWDDVEEQYQWNMQRLETARQWQAEFVRCVFGNPFRPVAFVPAWRTSTVVALAQGIYDDRAFDRLPILADALQDAGCDSDDMLNHCRTEAVHARGCWVVDAVLGKI